MLKYCSLVSNVGIGFTKPVRKVSDERNQTTVSSHLIRAHKKSNRRKYMQHRPNEYSTTYIPLTIQSSLFNQSNKECICYFPALKELLGGLEGEERMTVLSVVPVTTFSTMAIKKQIKNYQNLFNCSCKSLCLLCSYISLNNDLYTYRLLYMCFYYTVCEHNLN